MLINETFEMFTSSRSLSYNPRKKRNVGVSLGGADWPNDAVTVGCSNRLDRPELSPNRHEP
jgi:hypothetical protein